MTHATIGIHLKIIILNESSQIKKRVYEILENASESIVSCLEMWWRLEVKLLKDRRKLLGVMDVFIILNMMLIPFMCI